MTSKIDEIRERLKTQKLRLADVKYLTDLFSKEGIIRFECQHCLRFHPVSMKTIRERVETLFDD